MPNSRPDPTYLVGENLRALRKGAHLSQEALAERAGLSRATIAAIELGRYRSIELSTVDAIAEGLQVDQAVLMARPANERKFLQEFKQSAWFAAAQPTADEMRWLASLPDAFWGGMATDPRTLTELLELRRRRGAAAVPRPSSDGDARGRGVRSR